MGVSAKSAPLLALTLLVMATIALAAAAFFFYDPSVIPTSWFQCNGVNPCPSTRGGYAVAIGLALFGVCTLAAGAAVSLRPRNQSDF